MAITMSAHASGRSKRDWLAFDGLDYLITKIVLGIAVVGSVLFGLGGPIRDAVTNAPLPVSYSTKVTSGIPLPRGATHDGNATVELMLTDATLGERLTQALPELLIAAMTIAVAWLLYQLLRDTQSKEPFTRRNVWRITTTALIVGIGWTLADGWVEAPELGAVLGVADRAGVSLGPGVGVGSAHSFSGFSCSECCRKNTLICSRSRVWSGRTSSQTSAA